MGLLLGGMFVIKAECSGRNFRISGVPQCVDCLELWFGGRAYCP